MAKKLTQREQRYIRNFDKVNRNARLKSLAKAAYMTGYLDAIRPRWCKTLKEVETNHRKGLKEAKRAWAASWELSVQKVQRMRTAA